MSFKTKSVHNTWEPVENFDPSLIDEYEMKAQKAAKKMSKSLVNEVKDEEVASLPLNVEDMVLSPDMGFCLGYEPDKILGATENVRTRELLFLMKWKDSNKVDLVYAKKANVICPQVVIKFYEENLKWND